MNEVTSDLIAQIATRLLNDAPLNDAAQVSGMNPSAIEIPANIPPLPLAPPLGAAQMPGTDPWNAMTPVRGLQPRPLFPNPDPYPMSGPGDPSITPFERPAARSSALKSPGGAGPWGFLPASFSEAAVRGNLPGVSAFSAERYLPNDIQMHAPQSAGSVYQTLPAEPSPGLHPSAAAVTGGSYAGSSPPMADVSQEGLRRFVEQVRNPGGEAEPGFCPGSPGIKFLQQVLAVSPVPQTGLSGGSRPFDVPAIRRDFPALHQRVHGKPLVWFDNAATTQKPQSVIDAISNYYARDNSNIHRAAHTLAARSTDAFESVREKSQQFLGAASPKEIIFVRGTTEGINLIAQTYGKKFLQPGDEIVMSTLEHHANIVPWQMMARERGATLRVVPVNDRGEVMLEAYQALLGSRTKLVALTQASNSLGTILPVIEMTQMARRYGARVLIDGAQSVSHLPVNVQEIGCDFFVFSGHKIFGPTGIGVVYAREELQEIMPPWQGGGNMIKNVTFEETTFSDPPNKFEAGTPNIADTVGLGAALDYVQQLGLPNIGKYEHDLLEYATDRLLPIPGLRLIGQARDKVSVISFVLKDFRTEDVGKMLDQEGIAVRAGHHCSQPSLRRFGVESTVRPSLAFYNTTDEIDHLVASIQRINSRSVSIPQPSPGFSAMRPFP